MIIVYGHAMNLMRRHDPISWFYLLHHHLLLLCRDMIHESFLVNMKKRMDLHSHDESRSSLDGDGQIRVSTI
jgi:hypothetical protein